MLLSGSKPGCKRRETKMETEYDSDILPHREFNPEEEVYICFLCSEPVDEDVAISVKTDEGTYEYAHRHCCIKNNIFLAP